MLSDRRPERRAAGDEDRVAEDVQLVDEAELDRSRGQAGAADLHVLVGRVERRGDLLGQRRLGEAGVALDAVERPFRTQHPLGVVVNRPSVWPDR